MRRPNLTCPTSPTFASIRSSARAGQWMGRRRGAAILRLVQVSILALCVRPAADGQGTPDLPGFPADAKRRELQPRCSESGDGEKDGTGGGGEQRPQPVTEMTFRRAARKGRPGALLDRPGTEGHYLGSRWAMERQLRRHVSCPFSHPFPADGPGRSGSSTATQLYSSGG